MKSALLQRLIFSAGGLLILLFLFIGINVGYELPADRVVWFGAAVVVALLLIGYGWYAFRPNVDARAAVPSADARPQTRAADSTPPQPPSLDATKHAN